MLRQSLRSCQRPLYGFAFIAVIVPALLVGCRSTGVAPNPPGTGNIQQVAIFSCTPCAKANGYTSSTAASTVDLFKTNGTNSTQTISSGVVESSAGSVGAVFDGLGDLFVANCQSCWSGSPGTNNIVEYQSGSTSPSVTITVSSNSEPYDLAVDSSNNLYLSSLGFSTPSQVTEYPEGYTSGAPSRTISVDEPTGIATDSSGNLYVANCETCNPAPGDFDSTGKDQILVYAPGSTTPMRTITAGLDEPVALAIDSAGTLYVANCACGTNGSSTGSNTVTEYANGGTTLTNTIAGLDIPFAITVDSSNNLYVANYGANTVTKYAQGTTTPSLTITGLDDPDAVRVDRQGSIYVSNGGTTTVTVYSPTGTLTQTLNVSYPAAIAIH